MEELKTVEVPSLIGKNMKVAVLKEIKTIHGWRKIVQPLNEDGSINLLHTTFLI